MHKPRILLIPFLLVWVALACNLPLDTLQFSQTVSPDMLSPQSGFPVVTPSPTLTPTPSPTTRIRSAETLMQLGDFAAAREEYRRAALSTTDSDLQAAALLGIGKTYFQESNFAEATDTFRTLIEEHPPSTVTAEAHFWLGRAYDAQGDYLKASDAYAHFLNLKPGILDDFVQTLRGDALMNAGDYKGAIQAYQAALQATQGDTLSLQIKIGEAYAASNDFTNALTQFLRVYESSTNDYIKAQMNLRIGQIYLQLGYPEQAYARFMDSVNNFPRAYDSYSGLVALVNSGQPVDEFQRGLVDYYAGQYGYAIEAFTRYINTNPDHPGKAHFYRALSWRALGNYTQTVRELQDLIQTHPDDSLWPNAWRELAYTQWAYLETYDAAANTLKTYLQQAPAAPDAVEVRFEIARILERGGYLTEAATWWENLINDYPSSDLSYRALFLAGIAYYRAQKYPQALTAFQRFLVLGDNPTDRAAAWLWIGKCHLANGNSEEARQAWQEAASLDPLEYYGIRARELLDNAPPFTGPLNYDLGYDLDLERPLAEAWLRERFNISPEEDLAGPGALTANPIFQRADLLWRLGYPIKARDLFEALRQSFENDPANLYRLMNYTLDLGAYRTAIFSARRLLDLAGLPPVQTLEAPAYFNHIRFGLYYKPIVMEAAARENLHPLLIFSLMRQESFFESFVQSSAGAYGLMQLMPATASDLVNRYGWPPNFQEQDLLNPTINIRLGARYLALQRDYFNGNWYAALAAYNAGPGNAKIWLDLAGGDPDLFLEIIRYPETQNYIRQVAEFLELYTRVYERRP
ncbi:tetratricopeptide repeat protein [uncultured Thermanaerothrix sp.]|uniref:lytic transglycosylase domain-containing protein n=1 Tax=uncultured Thermanaerothrix sp. TaxID=1195149 RepID=UPI002620F128|nr:tetratricopeptide repeat protein [uncultured Thermanaerothrix sp.]